MWLWFNYFRRYGSFQVWTNSPEVFQTTSGLDLRSRKKIIWRFRSMFNKLVKPIPFSFFFFPDQGLVFVWVSTGYFCKAFTKLRLPIARQSLSMSIRSQKINEAWRWSQHSLSFHFTVSQNIIPRSLKQHQKQHSPPQLSVSSTGSHLLEEDSSMGCFFLFGRRPTVGVWNPPTLG